MRDISTEEYYRACEACDRMMPTKNIYLRSACLAQMILTKGKGSLPDSDRNYYQRVRDVNVMRYRQEISR
jgi:hypothetical protein